MRSDVKEFREFLRTVCVVSAMMASISFVGVSILVLIYSPSGVVEAGPWKDVAYYGIVAVYGFAATSIITLIALDPRLKVLGQKKVKEFIHKGIWILLLVSWISFLVLIAGLLLTFL